MKQKSVLRKTQLFFSILLLVSLLFLNPGADAATPIRTQVLNSGVIEADNAEDALNAALEAYLQQNPQTDVYRISAIQEEDGFAYASGEPYDAITGERVPEETFVALLAKQEPSGTWQSVAPTIVPDYLFNEFLMSFPDAVMDESMKAFLYIPEQASTGLITLNLNGYKLPWPNQQVGWVTRKNGSGHDLQVDFDILGGGTSGDVYAAKPGTVVFVKESSNQNCSVAPPDPCWKKANMVVIQHSASEYTWYVHLAYNSVTVSVGDVISSFGRKIAVEGTTGYSSGVHLHFMGSTGHTAWTDPNDPNAAPWGSGITAVDFAEVSWDGLTAGSTYTSQNAGGVSCDAGSVPSGFSKCSDEGGRCNFSGTKQVYYGAGSCYEVRSFSNGVDCNNDNFGDPVPGTPKACYIEGGTPSGNWNAKFFSGHDHWWDNNNFNNQMCERSINSSGLDENYGSSAPCGNGVGDNWVAEYNATINFPAGNYVFQAQNDDGLKMWLNGNNILERGGSQGLSYICPARPLNGNATIRAILNEDGGDARVKIAWTTDTSICELPANFSKLGPTNGSTGQSTSPVLSWENSGRANNYSYCIDTSNNNSCDTGWVGVGNVTSKPLSGLTPGTTYYWHVRAHSEGGETLSNGNAWWSFTTQSPLPPTPANFRITSSTATSITMAWDDVSDETGYKIYEWNGTDFVYLASVGANATSYTETRSECGWDEFYQVSAYNDNGESEKAGWIQGYTKPCKPTLMTPGNGSNHPSNYDLNFEWEPTPGATEYLVQWWGGPYSTMQPCEWITSTSCHIGTVYAGHTYSWRVKARNSAGQESIWSDTWTFTIQNVDLVVESITTSPASPIINQPVTFTVRVKNQGTADVDTDFYVDLFVDSQPVTDCTDSSDIWWSVLSLAAGATQDLTYTYNGFTTSGAHTLYAFADTNCYIEESNDDNNIRGPVTVTVQPAPLPGAFAKSTPANGAIGQPINPTLTWTASAGATSYQYCIDTTNDNACSPWVNNGASKSKALSGLSYSTTYYWHVRAVNAAGTRYSNRGPTAFWVFKTRSAPVRKTFTATVDDGWVLESGELSNVGGTMNATAATFNVGDEAGDKQYRGILSFNTAGLPDNAVITGVTFKVMQQGVIGTNPFSTHGNLLLDIIKSAFSGSPALQLTDFQAAASKNGVAALPNTPSAGWYTKALPASALTYINKAGVTQLRLRFALDDNEDLAADFLKFYSGNAVAANRPQLIIQYYLP